MRDYGAVSPQFWIGKTGKALRGNLPAQLVALYLMTSPHSNMIGVYYVTVDSVAKETGLTLEGASEALRSLVEADYCLFDEDTEEVFVKRMAAYQIGEQLDAKDNRCKGIARDVDKVSSDRLRSEFRAIYSGAFHLPKPAPNTPPASPPSGSPSEAPSKPGAGTGTEAGTGDSAKAAGAASAKPKSPEDLAKAELWKAAVSLFTGQGMPEPQARQFFGKLAKDFPDGSTVTDGLRNCIAEQPADARAWLTAECQRLSGIRKASRRPTSHSGLADKDYHQGVTADGTLA